jgi:hypothetical protein
MVSLNFFPKHQQKNRSASFQTTRLSHKDPWLPEQRRNWQQPIPRLYTLSPKKAEPPPSGNPAISVRPVAFRRRLTAVLALSIILKSYIKVYVNMK